MTLARLLSSEIQSKHVPERVPPERVLIVAPAASYRLPAYLQAAADLGCEPLVVSHGRYALSPAVAAGIVVDLVDAANSVDQVLAAVREGPPVKAAIATDDATLALTARICAALGLKHNSASAVRSARRKDHARAILLAAGVPVPDFVVLDLEMPLEPQFARITAYPCVVKPVAMSASRGVVRVDNLADLRSVVRRVSAIAANANAPEERRFLLIERFLPGDEIAVDAMLSDGRLTPLAVFDKPEPLNGPFFEESYYVTPSRLQPSVQEQALSVVAQACSAFGLREGPVHAELRIDGAEISILEVAARTIGGDCARMIEFQTGTSLETIVLSHALGRAQAPPSSACAVGVLMLPTPQAGTLRRVEGVLEARALPGVDDVVIALREGYELVPLPEGGSYLGFVFASGPSPSDVEATLRRANALIDVVCAPSWTIEAPAGMQTGRIRSG